MWTETKARNLCNRDNDMTWHGAADNGWLNTWETT